MPRLLFKDVDIRLKYKNNDEQWKKVLVQKRPRNGYNGEPEIEFGGMDALLVLVRALTAYGWNPVGVMNKMEAAIHKTAMMDLGWFEDDDKIVKKELADTIGSTIQLDMIFSDELQGFVQEHPDFQIIDNRYLNLVEGGSWEWKEYLGHTSVIHADGTKPIQRVMDNFFDEILTTTPQGEDRTRRRFSKCAKFIHVQYTSTGAQKFEDICRFDLNTLCIGNVVNGVHQIHRQEARYHILAIGTAGPGVPDDVRVYNQANSVILGQWGQLYDWNKKYMEVNRNWSISSDSRHRRFILIYYRVKNVPSFNLTLDDIPYRPVEYVRSGKVVEDAAPTTRGSSKVDRTRAVSRGSMSSLTSSSRPMPALSSKPQTGFMPYGPPDRGYSVTKNTFNVPTEHRGDRLGADTRSTYQPPLTSSGRGARTNIGGIQSGNTRGGGLNENRGLRPSGSRDSGMGPGGDSRTFPNEMRKDRYDQGASIPYGRSKGMVMNPLEYGSMSTTKLIPGFHVTTGPSEMDVDLLFEDQSEGARSEAEVEPLRTMTRLHNQRGNDRASDNRLCANIDKHLDGQNGMSGRTIWAQALRVVGKVKGSYAELAQWCENGCVGRSPCEKTSPAHKLQEALRMLHLQLKNEKEPGKRDLRLMKALLTEINAGYRAVVQDSWRTPQEWE